MCNDSITYVSVHYNTRTSHGRIGSDLIKHFENILMLFLNLTDLLETPPQYVCVNLHCSSLGLCPLLSINNGIWSASFQGSGFILYADSPSQEQNKKNIFNLVVVASDKKIRKKAFETLFSESHRETIYYTL